MYNIAILGCENSHADAFLKLISEGSYPEINVIGVYSDEQEAALKLHETFNVPIMESFDSAVGKVDGIMVTARHGDNHLKYVEPYMKSGIPMFIDKPITIKPDEAERMIELAKANGVRLCGGSTCAHLEQTVELKKEFESVGKDIVGGTVIAPLSPKSIYGGFYFYAQHLVQIITEIFGSCIKAVTAIPNGNTISVIAEYEKFNVNATYSEISWYYHATIYERKTAVSRILELNDDSFRNEMDAMYSLLKGEDMSVSYEELIYPVYVMNAIESSIATGKRVEIR